MKDSGLKIALINATPNDYGYLEPNLGILSIASYLLKKGIVSKDMDYSRLRLLVPLRKTAKLFFKEKVTYKEYSQVLQQARKLYWWIEKRNKKQKGAAEIFESNR